ncbi:MAG: MBL fold metallo-hydrolase [Anaerolineales bacterium]|nr:MBL fold metallo-hydrolase [Anaerolineales bacterium]
MLRERIAEDVSFFSSDLYAQVCAGVIGTPDGAILIDTLALPSETREIREYVEQRMNTKVRFVINTHYHADHCGGNYIFPEAQIISHEICRNLMETMSRKALESAKSENKELSDAEVILPNVTFRDGSLYFLVGKRTIRIFPLPGHSPDGIGVLLEEERILFAGDAMMPLPFFRDGDLDTLAATLKTINGMGLENIVQGHGDVILRGEIDEMISSHLVYLERIRKETQNAVRWNWSLEDLRQLPIEKCGKSRILLNGLAPDLHFQNLTSAFLKAQKTAGVAPALKKPSGR